MTLLHTCKRLIPKDQSAVTIKMLNINKKYLRNHKKFLNLELYLVKQMGLIPLLKTDTD